MKLGSNPNIIYTTTSIKGMDQLQITQTLERMPLLAQLSPNEIEQIAAITKHQRITRFQFIYMADEKADHIYFLIKGKIKMGTFSSDGREVIREILQPEQLFGELAFTGDFLRVDFAQAMQEEVELLVINMQDFRKLMTDLPTLTFACIAHLNTRLSRAEERLSSLVLKDARERIIDFLVETAGREGRKVGYETLVKHQLTQQEIANLTGTSRQTVTSVLNDLRKANLIYFNRNSILIRDLQKLA
jgi:CRP/FNR family cyclic AMP-dependent transcriptional regulator